MAENEIPISFKWYLNRQGIQGQQGERGEEGFSPTITVNEDTLTAYTLKVQNKTGSFVTPNLRQVVSDSGGTYIRYDRTSGNLYAGNADFATTEQAGMVRFCTEEELNSAYDGSVVSPADLKEYIDNNATGGGSDLNNIADADSGVAITDVDSGLTYPQTINIITATEDENYSYIQCTSSGSGLSSGIKFNLNNLTLMAGRLNGVTSAGSAGIKLSAFQVGTNPSTIISEPVFLKGKQDVSNVVDNLLAFDYTHTSGTSNNYRSNGFFIFDRQSSYAGTFTTNGILFTAGDEPSIKFTTSTADGGIWTDNINATVLTDKTGVQYQALTQSEYDELEAKSESTMYRTTDTNEVYLGTIPLTGGASAQYKTLLISNYDNATQTNLGGSTTVQVTDTEV